MSRSKNTGKAWRKVRLRPEFPAASDTIKQRHTYGSTHRILRRCRKIWTRLLGKQRRAVDREVIGQSAEG